MAKILWQWLDFWGTYINITTSNNDKLKLYIPNKVTQKLLSDDNIKNKRKLTYYKNIVNPKLDHPSCLNKIISVKKKLAIKN